MRGLRHTGPDFAATRADDPGMSLQPKIQGERGEGEDDGVGDGDAVEVALDHGGTLGGGSYGTAEHVRQPTTLAAVHQDEEDQAERRDNFNDDVDPGSYGHCYESSNTVRSGQNGLGTVAGGAGSNDVKEAGCLQARPPHQQAVDVGFHHQIG